MIYKHFLKRWIDFTVSLLLLALTLPITLVVTLLLYFANDGKPFFFQTRPGKNERLFTIIKFKTMNDKKDNKGNLLPDKDRLTPIGKFVRSTSLDEIPQLLNVLKGEMSLIGPRPLLPEYLPLYNDFQRKRHLVRPGITGWAQVNGRNSLSWEEKFKADVYYVENLSFTLDVAIYFKTLTKVFKREGISSTTSATMEKFTGNNV